MKIPRPTGKREDGSGDERRCAEVRQMLHARWFEGSGDVLPLRSGESSIALLCEHVEECTHCLDEVEALEDLDGTLRQSFLQLAETVSEPEQEERMDQTLARLREAPELGLLRRLRRGARLVLWTAFYSFTFLAACLLVVAAYHALKELMSF